VLSQYRRRPDIVQCRIQAGTEDLRDRGQDRRRTVKELANPGQESPHHFSLQGDRHTASGLAKTNKKRMTGQDHPSMVHNIGSDI